MKVIPLLTQMLEEANALKDFPIPEQTIYKRAAHLFQENTSYLFYSPEELHEYSGFATKEHWKTLLDLQETKNFIKAQMAALAQIAQRKTFKSLINMALEGNQQAAKQIQELSGAYNNADSNKVIILTHIPRPTQEVKQWKISMSK